MHVRRSACLYALPLWLSALGPPALAQRPDGDLRAVPVWLGADSRDKVHALIDGDDNLAEVVPNIRDAADFPVPMRYRDDSTIAYWRDGALYTLAYGDLDRDAGGALSQLWTLAKWEGGEWHHLGGIKTRPKGLLKAIPCDGGRFIAISSDIGMFGDGRSDPTPFQVLSLPQEGTRLRLDRHMGHGQDDLRGHMSDGECFAQAFLSRCYRTDSHAVLVNRRTGLYWVLSLEKASLVKAGCIFKKVTPEMVAKDGFPNAVLCVDVEKAGTVLVAAQDEDFFTTEMADPERELNELLASEAFDNSQHQWALAVEARERGWREMAERNPFIVWYRIYPESGRVEELIDPPEGGTFFREGGNNDGFRAMPDGSVKIGGWAGVMGRLDEKVRRGWKKADKKDTSTKSSGGAEDAPKEVEGAESGAGGGGPAEGGALPQVGTDGGVAKGRGHDNASSGAGKGAYGCGAGAPAAMGAA
jgi:hypothetical protein